MSSLSLLTNLMHPIQIKVLIYFKTKKVGPKLSNSGANSGLL